MLKLITEKLYYELQYWLILIFSITSIKVQIVPTERCKLIELTIALIWISWTFSFRQISTSHGSKTQCGDCRRYRCWLLLLARTSDNVQTIDDEPLWRLDSIINSAWNKIAWALLALRSPNRSSSGFRILIEIEEP